MPAVTLILTALLDRIEPQTSFTTNSTVKVSQLLLTLAVNQTKIAEKVMVYLVMATRIQQHTARARRQILQKITI